MMSMAHSLEVRVPLTDHVLVENALYVRGHDKLSNQRSKPLMANAMEHLLPKSITNGTKKTFTFPFQVWLQNKLADVVKGRLIKCA